MFNLGFPEDAPHFVIVVLIFGTSRIPDSDVAWRGHQELSRSPSGTSRTRRTEKT